MSSGSLEDMAEELSKELSKEKVNSFYFALFAFLEFTAEKY